MYTKLYCKAATLVLLGILTFAGCSLFGGGASATMRDYFRYAGENKPEEMVKLFSNSYLARETHALEESREFVKFMQSGTPKGSQTTVSDMSEKVEGEYASVKGQYGLSGVPQTRSFEARLVKENGEWKIDALERH